MNLNLARPAARKWMEVVMKNDLTGKRFGRLTAKFVCGKSKALIEHFYNDHDIVIAIAEMERCEGWEVSE